MEHLYKKSELTFALVWIALYSILQSLANSLNGLIGVEFSANAAVNILLTAILFRFIQKNGLLQRYGICKTSIPPQKFLWYIPLLILASHNLWNGAALNLPLAGTVCYLLYMLCVGFLEEAIFRGLLFKAIAKDNIKSAIVVSSVTFGLGHLLNLFNGSGMGLVANLCQVMGAIAIGFLFVTIFYRSGSLISCIITHSAIDMVSAFANEADLTAEKRILFSLSRLVIVVGYTLFLQKMLPHPEEETHHTAPKESIF